MPSPFGPMHVVLNPRAGRGSAGARWADVRAVIEAEDLEHDVSFTEGPGHAIELARTAVLEGCRFVVGVGGDGTFHEIVNGMMGAEGPLDPEAVIGLVPAGSGSDLVRTFGLSHEPAAAARHLGGTTLWGKLDVGRVRFRGERGDDGMRWFVNVAEGGIGAQVVRAAASMPRWLGGRAYRLAALKGIVTYKPQDATLRIHGRSARRTRPDAPLEELTHAARATMVVVANCQFFGGGLRVAPRAIPSDGVLDVLVGAGSKRDAVAALRAMPLGEHVPSPTIAEFLADRVTLDAPEPIWIEADGEVLGTTPATFDVVPGAIPLKI